MITAKDFEEFFASFNESDVRYLIVAGYAFALHAHPRYTRDLGVFVEASDQNARRIISALKEFGFALPELTWSDFTAGRRSVQLGHPPLRIDIMTALDGVSFGEA